MIEPNHRVECPFATVGFQVARFDRLLIQVCAFVYCPSESRFAHPNAFSYTSYLGVMNAVANRPISAVMFMSITRSGGKCSRFEREKRFCRKEEMKMCST